MMSKAEQAKAYFKEGYNCCQAVVLAFTEEMNLEPQAALAIASSFGGGIGRLREVCGAFSGVCIVAGALYGYTDPKAKEEKAAHYQLIQQMAKEFEDRNGSIICGVLTGIKKDSHIPTERTEAFYQKRPCVELVGDAAEILEKIIQEKKN
ncbi:MAG: C_GCAxxG_C_C family protein [Clostridia bacterium]|nr:C_GCAxxG_C_C family protein [Clostridia bacterium]